jgi:hypothetical protein
LGLAKILRQAKVVDNIDNDKVSFSSLQYLKDVLGSAEESDPMNKKNIYFRASGIGRMCAREEVLCSIGNVKRTFNISAGLDVTFNIGNGVHSFLQEKLKDILLGHWKCKNCHFKIGEEPSMKVYECPKKKCKCGTNDWEYVEIYAYDKEYKMGGHPDGILNVKPQRALLELKTINDGGFTSLSFNGPSDWYVWQMQLYMHLLGLKTGFLLYVNKSTSEFKEFVIKYDKKIAQEIKEKATMVIDGINGGPIPNRTVCAKKTDSRARMCPVKNQCFSIKE